MMLGDGLDKCELDILLDSRNRQENIQFINDATKEFNESGLEGDFDTCCT